MADLGAILADLAAETDTLDDLVAALPAAEWGRPTPAEGWTVAHQIAHLRWTDGMTLIAVTRPQDWPAELEKALTIPDLVDRCAAEGAELPPDRLLAEWRDGRAALADALAALPHGQKIPWYGPAMTATTMATARIMETWAHGQDVFDGLGRTREPTARLRHVAWFGVRTRDFAFKLHSLAPPVDEFRVELTAPDGSTWAFGPEDAEERLTGSALDFCLVVTQRRHPADTDLVVTGESVEEWLGIAQTFAGPPGAGREPGRSR